MYALEIKEEPDKVFFRLSKKNPAELKRINKKIEQIRENPYRFKPLRNELKGEWRVHVGHFVLVYKIIESEKTVEIVRYKHHDDTYEK